MLKRLIRKQRRLKIRLRIKSNIIFYYKEYGYPTKINREKRLDANR